MVETLPRRAVGPAPRRHWLRALAAAALRGLTSMEVLAAGIVAVATAAFLWASGALAPESLVTDPRLRTAWCVLVLATLRPATWIPFVLAFLPARALAARVVPGASPRATNGAAAAIALAAVGLISLATLATVPGAATWTSSLLAFAAGGAGFEDLGRSGGDWDALRVLGVVAVLLLVRPVVPPLGDDLSPGDPVVGFVPGRRGRVDRALVLAAVVLAALLGVATYAVTR